MVLSETRLPLYRIPQIMTRLFPHVISKSFSFLSGLHYLNRFIIVSEEVYDQHF